MFFVQLLNNPRIALDTVRGKIYWVNNSRAVIQRSNLDGTAVEEIVSGLTNPNGGIAVDVAGGKVYWTDFEAQKIQRANLDGTAVEDLLTSTSGLVLPTDLALDVCAGKMYWTDLGFRRDPGTIRRANLDGSHIEERVVGPKAFGIALDTARQQMYWTNSEEGTIQRANLDGTHIEDLVTGLSFGGPLGIALLLTPTVNPLTICQFTATPTQGQLPLVNIPVVFALTVADPTKVQSVQWDFNGDDTVDQTTAALTTQFTYPTAGTFQAMVTVIGTDGSHASAATTVIVQSASQAIDTAKSLVQQLPLQSGQKNNLVSKLQDAQHLITIGNITGACGKLSDVVSQINAFVSSGQLSAASAAPVLDEVHAIQRSLGCQ